LNKTILCVGAGIFQYYAIKKAKESGLRVFAIDKDEHAPGIALCDNFMPVSTKDIDAAIKAAKSLNKIHKINGVMTCGTDVSYTVAHIAKALNLPGIPPETALKATNKGIMREALKKGRVTVPEFSIINNLKDAISAAKKLKYPLVIKPVDNMGARGVRKLSCDKDLIVAWDEAFKYSTCKNIIIEKFVDGHEISLETIVENGKVHLVTIADRIIASSPYFIERGHTIPSIRPVNELKAAFQMAIKGIKALNITRGPVKFDMKLSSHGPIIGEMTARSSGGFHSQLTEPLATGMSSIKAVIDLALGFPLDISDITPKFLHAAAERSIYPKPGVVTSIKGVEKARAMKNIAGIFLNVREGDTLFPLKSNIGKAGHVVGFGNTRKEAIKTTLNAVKAIHIKTAEK